MPMGKHVLITGGAGFIGSHLADALLRSGHRVRVLDSLSAQVHGPGQERPRYLSPDVELVVGDVRDEEMIRQSLKEIEVVYHLAAAVGVGQSMYEIERYVSTNDCGTAVLLQVLLDRPVERLIVASSMSIYGEGLYANSRGQICHTTPRDLPQLKAGRWEIEQEGEVLRPVPTPESKAPDLASVYALSKWDQERLCLMVGRSYSIPTVALRFFNVYGPRQALSNPYTGVLAIFAARLLNNKPPLIFEDGLQKRDFVSVHDVAAACLLALDCPQADGQVFNVGSGESYTIGEIAEAVARAVGKQHQRPVVTGKYRVGDIRHCFADISVARSVLGYRPRYTLESGLEELGAWLQGQTAYDRVETASAELAARGLTI